MTDVVLKLPGQKFVANEWGISNWQRLFPTFGILKEFRAEWDLFLICRRVHLEEVIYFASYVVTDPGETTLEKKQLLSEKEYRAYREKYGNKFQASMGAEAIKKLLQISI